MNTRSKSGAPQARPDLGTPRPLQGPPLSRRHTRAVLHRLGNWMQTNTCAPSWLPVWLRPPAVGYLAAALLAAAAVWLTLLLRALVPGFDLLTLLVLVTVVLVALTWGRGPSLLTTLVGAVLLEYFVLPPPFSWFLSSGGSAINLGLFLLVGLLISLVAGQVALARGQNEQACQEAEARADQLQTIFDTMVEGVFVYDREGHIIAHNAAVRAHLGLDQVPEAVGWTPEEWAAHLNRRDIQGQPIPVEQAASSRILRGEVLRGKAALDEQMRTLDGREIFASLTGAPIRNRQGQMTGAVMVGRDVTERHQLEQRTQKALFALIQLAHAVGTAPPQDVPQTSVLAQQMAVFTCEALGEGHVMLTRWDQETGCLHPLVAAGLTSEQERLWRASFEDLPLRAWWGPTVAARLEAGEVVQIAEADTALAAAPNLFGLPRRLLAPLRSNRHLIGFVVLGRAGDKPPFTLQEAALLGTVAQLCALVLERERLLCEWQTAQARVLALEQAKEQMEAFLTIASHELKTPLTSLRLGFELVKKRVVRLRPGDPETVEWLNASQAHLLAHLARWEQQFKRIEHLVGDLLDVSSIQAGQLPLCLEQADLVNLVRGVVQDQQEAHPERLIQVRLPATAPLLLRVDAERIGQVITNYLTNALKYSSENQPVEVGLEGTVHQARVWVRDQGPDIPADEQAHLWERFHRVPNIVVQSGSEIGLGLGLSICRSIIERHGGQVGVESAPGKGSTFWFTLPLQSASDAA